MPKPTAAANAAPLPAPKVPHYAAALSFMALRKPRGSGIDHWVVSPTGHYGADLETGERLADEFLAFIGAHPTVGHSTLLPCVIRDMIDHAVAGQRWSGVHAGFVRGVNQYAMAAARIIASSSAEEATHA
ncbi:UNVERIFIED_ORG: hypothetical protein ABID33_003858 [Xanthobacter viscosus]|uniref:Uncharacterized protein n=1 Tax=Xanthobacter autotrophicus TaxID=280 RepID=A0A6C1KJT2_XANAU|nr:hypothetical protein [Xanthobacter autotrophicus]TLX44470.1 hypothetical protein FBQ73_02500 [Xanthobacter autotrophicus]